MADYPPAILPGPPLARPLVVYPLDRTPKWRESGLGAKRPVSGTGTRHHAGIDIGAAYGDVVYAMAPGKMIRAHNHAGDEAKVLLIGDELGVIAYGAVAPNSWTEFGLKKGSPVSAGQPVARIGRYPKHGETMLHVLALAPGSRKTVKWKRGEPPPPNLRDIRVYLRQAVPVRDVGVLAPVADCDPLAPGCPPGMECFPQGERFVCRPVACDEAVCPPGQGCYPDNAGRMRCAPEGSPEGPSEGPGAPDDHGGGGAGGSEGPSEEVSPAMAAAALAGGAALLWALWG